VKSYYKRSDTFAVFSQSSKPAEGPDELYNQCLFPSTVFMPVNVDNFVL